MKDWCIITFNQTVHDMLAVSFPGYSLPDGFFVLTELVGLVYLFIFDWSEVAACLNTFEP